MILLYFFFVLLKTIIKHSFILIILNSSNFHLEVQIVIYLSSRGS